MFSEQFREQIGRYKYAYWAKDLTGEQLEALFWAVGEYGYRSAELLRILQQHTPANSLSYARAIYALEILAEFTLEKPIAIEPFRKRLRQVLGDKRRAITGTLPPSDQDKEL